MHPHKHSVNHYFLSFCSPSAAQLLLPAAPVLPSSLPSPRSAHVGAPAQLHVQSSHDVMHCSADWSKTGCATMTTMMMIDTASTAVMPMRT